MHQKALGSHFDFPFVTYLGGEVIQHGELLQVLVPPIHLIVAFINIFVGFFGIEIFVVKGVDAHKDMYGVFVDGSVGGVFQMLVSDAAVRILNLIIPLRPDGEEAHLNDVGELVPPRGFLISRQRALRHINGGASGYIVEGMVNHRGIDRWRHRVIDIDFLQFGTPQK